MIINWVSSDRRANGPRTVSCAKARQYLGPCLSLQPQELDALVFGPPRRGVRLPGYLVPPHMVIHQRDRPRQPQVRLRQRRLQQPYRPVQRQLQRSFPSIAEEFGISQRTSGALYAVER